MTTLMWFRHDLRIYDNPALFKAAEQGRADNGVVAVYVHCESYVKRHVIAPAKLDFIRRSLHVLRKDLTALHIPLVLIKVKKPEDVGPALLKLVRSLAVSHCYFNAEYPVDELARDQQVNQLLGKEGVLVKRCHDRVIVPPGRIRNGQGEPYKVFTAFKKTWLQTVMPITLRPDGLPAQQKKNAVAARAIKTAGSPTTDAAINQLFAGHPMRDLSTHWPAGEHEAHRRLEDFIAEKIHNYPDARDFPGVQGTSMLSPYFAVGAISPRQAVAAVLAESQGEWEGMHAGVQCWINEIIWRDFYQHVVADYPDVCKHKPMQPHTDAFPWVHDQALFRAWCEGRTGIPIVDAAMRQLNSIGWMHNRLRMVVAMFLTKNMQIDWRLGERYFMSQLIDGDFAANNGGWQWSASTGTDAAPYFRIFNPVSQSRRFDPDGQFIREWVPELVDLSGKHIHEPPVVAGYPVAIVDLAKTRKNTIALFKAIR